jgi:hypothetical protein
MDLKDATLMILAESAAHPTLAKTAQSAYESLSDGREVPHGVLSDMLGEASGKGIIRALRQKYSATAFEAMIQDLPGTLKSPPQQANVALGARPALPPNVLPGRLAYRPMAQWNDRP